MNTIPYLQYITLDTNIQFGALPYFTESDELHIFAPNIVSLPRFKNKNVYMYVFNVEQYHLAKQANYIPHICIINDNLIDHELLSFVSPDLEVFWFPTKQALNNYEIYSKQLNILNIPICISYNEFIHSDIEPEIFRNFIKEIHLNFDNPLFTKEKSLLLQEQQELELYTRCLLQEDGVLFLKNIVLGLFGDCIVKNNKDYFMINKKSILKNLECMQCEYNEQCLNRGIGYIMQHNNYKGCISIKLMQPSK